MRTVFRQGAEFVRIEPAEHTADDAIDPISGQCPRRRGTMGSTPSPNQR
jgi:hypothetical protein